MNIIYNIDFTNFFIPALSIQPIVENAVRHGVMKRERGGTVIINTKDAENEVIITIIDDGVGFKPNTPDMDDRIYVGINNVRKRLLAMCNGTLELNSNPDVGTTAVIKIPKGSK